MTLISSYPDLTPWIATQSRPGAADLISFLKNEVDLFRHVPLPVLQELARQARLQRFVRGQYIWQIGDPARELWVVLKGRVSIQWSGPKGNTVSLEVMVSGNATGLHGLFCRAHLSNLQAARDSLLVAIPGEILLRQFGQCPDLARETLRILGERLNFLESQVLFSREPVASRLAAALLYLHHKFGITLPMTRAEIGEMAGTTPETTMRMLKVFEGRGWLKRHRHAVAIRDVPGLRTELIGNFRNPRCGPDLAANRERRIPNPHTR